MMNAPTTGSRDVYTNLVAHVLFPLHELMKRHTTVRVRKFMEVSQWWSPEKLEAYRIQRLKDFLLKIAIEVPYYQKLFTDIGFSPRDITSVADLNAIPFLTKSIIREHTDELKSRHAKSLSRFNTGGSSGEPLIFYIGNERVSHDVAAKWRATRWWGVDIGDPEIVVWGSPIEHGAQDRVRDIRDKMMRTQLLPAFEMSEQKLEHFVEKIVAIRPKMLFGYPSSISHIARYAEQQGRHMDKLGVKVVFVTSERLYDHQREKIEQVFGCPVANGYGGRDAGFIAHQCPYGGMHITSEDIVVEIIDKEGSILPSGHAGEVVVTHMATSEFPFVRYRTGDVAVLDEKICECGRSLPLLKEIQGRTTDFIVAKDGTVMHGLALIYVIRDVPGVKEFKIVQESMEHTRVQIVTDNTFSKTDIESIRSGIGQRLGEDVRIDVECVENIPAETSGKHRYIISKVDV